MAKAIMVQGTASGVGKTIITMALCRIFKQDGHNVAPFKAQNITSNTAVTSHGDEIAVSQMLQALAAGIQPDAKMNPVLLKPRPGGGEAILNGHSVGEISASNFSASKKDLVPFIVNAYKTLSMRHDLIVIEGAGSPVELNLKKNDIVNMGLAKRLKAPVVIVSDIDRGGVFASLYGTVKLFSESERKHVKATIINRFKGDIISYKSGIKIIEKITDLPVAGVVPYVQLNLPEEDCLYSAKAPSYSPVGNYESQFNLVADAVRQSLKMALIYKIINEGME